MHVFWKYDTTVINVDARGKQAGDTIPAPLNVEECEKLGKRTNLALKIRLTDDVTVTCDDYYQQDSDGLAQFVFLTGLPEIDGFQLGALILTGNEFTVVGDSPTPPTPPTPEPEWVEDGNWIYKIDGNYFEAHYKATGQEFTITEPSANIYRGSLTAVTLPTALASANIHSGSVDVMHHNYITWGVLASVGETLEFYPVSGGSRNTNRNYTVVIDIFGKVGE